MSSYELELVLLEINKMMEKEKGLRGKVLLNNAFTSLKDYETHIAANGNAETGKDLNKEYKAKSRRVLR